MSKKNSRSRSAVPPSAPSQIGIPRWAPLLLLAAPLLVYARTLGFGFSYHDDDVIILDGASVLSQGFSFSNIFLTDAWLKVKTIELYRPLQSLSYWLDYRLFGARPGGYHAHNLILHLLNVWLAWRLFGLLLRNESLALLAALVWGLNFLNTHAVCWIPARGDLLLALWGIVFLISWVRLLREPEPKWFALNMLAFACALLAKENAMLLPVFAGALWLIERRSAASRPLSSPAPLAAGWGAAAIAYLVLRSQSIASEGQNLSLSALARNLRVLPESLLKWFLPLKFSVMPGYDRLMTLGGLALAACLFFLIKKMLAKAPQYRKVGLFALALALLPLLPSMLYAPQFVSYGYDYLDHRMYFPSLGLALWFALLWTHFFEKNQDAERQIPWGLSVGVAALYFGLFAFLHNRHYRDYEAYYRNAIATNPRSGLALTNYGILQRKAGKQSEAEKWLNKALSVAPNYDLLQVEYATLLNEKGDYEGAREILDRLLSNAENVRAPRHLLLCHRGVALARTGRIPEAIRDLEEATALNPKEAGYFQNLGAAYEDANRSEDAIRAYSQALRLDPKLAQSLYRRGFQYGKTGRPREALADLERALALEPGRAELHYFKAMAHKDLDDRDNYCIHMRRAAELGMAEATQGVEMFCR
ncbi:MAG: tetratricopeptide repeat protein [Saprospiraceae bacterium]